MKNLLILIIFLHSLIGFSQNIQSKAPWMQNTELQKKSKPTLNEISRSAEAYFKTIDRYKKGSGLKPFERWRYHWSFYTKEDGTLSTSDDLWKSWEQKNRVGKKQAKANQSNWKPLGPFKSSNTYSSTSLKSSGQGRVNVVAVDPNNSNTYYVGAPAGGIWKSLDAGVSWTPLTDYLPQIGVSGIAIHPTDSNIIYIATGDDDAGDSFSVGVWKSVDGGTTWNKTGDIPGNPHFMNDIYINPSTPETVLVATSTGVQKTTNGGANWTNTLSFNSNSTQTNIDLKMKPGDPSIWYFAASNKFWKSTNGGDSFTQKTISGLTSSSRLSMDVTIANNNYIYIVSYLPGSGPNENGFNGIYKSTNSGETFTKTNENDDIFGSSQAWFDLALTVSDVNPEILYVGVLDIWKSINGGDNFFKINNWFSPDQASYTHADIHFLRFIDGKLFAGTDGGVYVSTDEGTKFTDLSENLSISQFYKISVSPKNSTILAGGLQDNGGFAFNGQNWNNYHGGDGMEGIVDPTNSNISYGFIQYGSYLNQTKDNGTKLSYQLQAPAEEIDTENSDSGGQWVTPLVANSKGEIIAGYKKLYKVVNGAWSKLSDKTFNGADLQNIEIDPQNDEIIYVTQSDGLFKSTNGGVSFNKLNYSGFNINDIEISNSDSNIMWIISNDRIHKSTNIKSDSPTFTEVVKNNTPTDSKITIVSHERGNNNTVYLGTSLGVYYTNDNLDEWVVFDNNLPNVAIRDLEINEDDAKLFAATYGRGVFVSDIPRTLPPFDLSLIKATIPNTVSCGLASPIVTVKNLGANSITTFSINYSIDNGATNTFVWNGDLSSNQTIDVSFPAISTSLGNHYMSLETILTNDAYNSNNREVTLNFGTNDSNVTPTTINSFENNDNKLFVQTTGLSDTDVWEIATPNKMLLNSAATGSKAYITRASGNYPDQTTSYLYTNCYDLSAITNPVMAFKMAFDIEFEWDYLVMEYSTDSGTNWSILGSANDPNWYNSSATTDSSNVSDLPGRQWTGEGETSNPLGGTNATIHDYSYDLSSLSSEKNIVFRFKFATDQAANEEGVMIDDFVINGTLSVINEELQNGFLVYPNPSESIYNISWSTDGVSNISVYNYLGKTIFEQKNITEKFYQVNLEKQSKGLYFIKLNVDGKQAVKKVILK